MLRYVWWWCWYVTQRASDEGPGARAGIAWARVSPSSPLLVALRLLIYGVETTVLQIVRMLGGGCGGGGVFLLS